MNLRWIVLRLSLVLVWVSALGPTLPPAHAGSGGWNNIGPEGGAITAIAIDPVQSNIVYAGTLQGGVYKSTDGGDTWQPSSAGLDGSWIYTLLIDPQHPNVLYAAHDRGLSKSGTGGAQWAAADQGLPGRDTELVAFGPADPTTLYALINEPFATFDHPFGLYRSTNGGFSWELMDAYGLDAAGADLNPAPGTGAVLAGTYQSFAVDPSDATVLYAGTHNNYQVSSVLRSQDAGQTWISTPLDAPRPMGATALVVDPNNTQVVYVGTSPGIHCVGRGCETLPAQGVLRSDDRGEHWTVINTGIEQEWIVALALDAAHPGRIYAGTQESGMFKTDNGGQTWAPINTGLGELKVNALALDSGGQRLYAGTDHGLFISEDGGEQWTPSNDGLTAIHVRAMTLNPAMAGALTAYSTEVGLVQSQNAGQSWTPVSAGFPSPDYQSRVTLETDPVSGTTLFLTSGGSPFRSLDGGETWLTTTTGLPPIIAIEDVLFDPNDLTTVYLGGPGLYKSTDLGASWVNAAAGLNGWIVPALASHPTDPNRLFAAATKPGNDNFWICRVYTSDNNGATWEAFGPPLGNDTVCPHGLVRGLAVSPVATATVYMTQFGMLDRLREGELEWTHIFNGGKALVIDPTAPETLYLMETSGQVYKSVDGGDTWLHLQPGPGFFANGALPLQAIALDPHDPDRLYVATDGGGIWVLDQTLEVDTIFPPNLPAGGGGAVMIVGADFGPDTTVTAGGEAATSIIVHDTSRLTAFFGPNTLGPADIVVGNLDGETVTRTDAVQFVETAATVFLPLLPKQGP